MTSELKFTGLEIAIVGIACRVPGARNWREFWDNLLLGKESIETYSKEELAAVGLENNLNSKKFVNVKSAFKDKQNFDSAFFNYTPLEAEIMNPIHRVFHECIWEALEDASHNPETFKGLISLYAGAGDDLNWRAYSILRNRKLGLDELTLNTLSSKDYLASLVSYKLNLKGSASFISTACSTSLVAIHHACRSLLLGESKLALAGGISLSTKTQIGYFHKEGTIYSEDGHCRVFDAEASGTIGGEGVGVVVLKRLKDAIEERDHIYAVIKGTATNNDGNRKVGFTAPSIDGQVDCIKRAHAYAKISPKLVSYIEAHGTGTRLGDPIEIEALNVAFDNHRDKTCAIGSVKSNFGHLDAAAGVIGLIKVALSLKFQLIPPSINFKSPNPNIKFEEGPFFVNDCLKSWERTNNHPLIGAVSSFGIGGTNAHAVLEEPPILKDQISDSNPRLLLMSARSIQALTRNQIRLSEFLAQHPETGTLNLASVYATGRKVFDFRKKFLFNDIITLINDLKTAKPIIPNAQPSKQNNQVIFVFPGQGSQYLKMGKDLYEKEPMFKSHLQKGFQILKTLSGESFESILFIDSDASWIKDPYYSQTLIFLIEYALAKFLIDLGVFPSKLIGHSLGEYAAACISQVMTIEETLEILLIRGRLLRTLKPGRMISARISLQDAQKYITSEVDIAVINSENDIVFSGGEHQMAILIESFNNENITYLELNTSCAFHSPIVDPILKVFQDRLVKYNFRDPKIPFFSNASGKLVDSDNKVSSDYWVRHLRSAVRFSECLEKIVENDSNVTFLEIGPGEILTKIIKKRLGKTKNSITVNTMNSSANGRGEQAFLLETIGRLWEEGLNINWAKYYSSSNAKRISLPTYSFEPTHYKSEVDVEVPSSDISLSFNSKINLSKYLYGVKWKIIDPPAVIERNLPKKVLLFSTENDFCFKFNEELESNQAIVTKVIIAEKFEQINEFTFSINPKEGNSIKQLFSIIKNLEQIEHIYYCWPIDVESTYQEVNDQNLSLHLLFFSWAEIIKNYAQHTPVTKQTFFVYTNKLQSLEAGSQVAYWQSLVLALTNIISQEYQVKCRVVDLDLSYDYTEMAKASYGETLIEEPVSNVALRAKDRWTQDYYRLEVQPAQTKIVEKGIYMVTGGLGNVGFVLAKYLVTRYAVRLIIIGRSQMDTVNSSGVFQERLRELRTISSDIHYFSVDVSHRDRLDAVVNSVEQNIGKIQGLIHAAGNVEKGSFELIENLSYSSAIGTFGPKIVGLLNLFDIFKERSLEFAWITSSLSVIVGGLGYSSYSAANSFMNYFISSTYNKSSIWKSVGLGEMLFSENAIEEELKGVRSALIPSEICEVFESSLHIPYPVIYQSVSDLQLRLVRAFSLEDMPSHLSYSKQHLSRGLLSSKYEPASSSTEVRLLKLVEDFFDIQGVGVEDSFFDIGGDSLRAMVLLKKIRNEFGVNIALTDFFSLTTIKQLAEEVDALMWISQGGQKAYTSIV